MPLLEGLDLTLHLPIWALTVEMWNCHSWPLDATTGGVRSVTSSANMSSNSRNVKLPFLTARCQYKGGRSAIRSATSSANMTSNSRNVKLHHSWPLDATTGGLDLPLHLPIWALTVEMSNCHSWPLDATTGGLDLPLHLTIWALTVKMWNCLSWPLDATTGA